MRAFVTASLVVAVVGVCSSQQQQLQPQSQYPPTQQVPPQPPAQERNKFIVELEKQIAGKEELPAEQVFKNIEIFKGDPAKRVLRTMEFAYAPALGVECNHCHVEGKWESDEKAAKGIARKMRKMLGDVNKMVKEITDEKSVVNCYTCHRGDVKPAIGARRQPRQNPQ